MIISLIAAVDKNLGIGIGNQLPWHLPADLAHFKRITMGHHLLAGRKTYQSIGGPLPGREMIVLTRDPGFQAEGCRIASSLAQGLDLARAAGEEELFVIGGAEIYTESLPVADYLYLTHIQGEFQVDVYFPSFEHLDWQIIEEEHFPADDRNSYPHTYRTYRRSGIDR